MRARLTALCIGWTCVNASAQTLLDTIQALHPDSGVAGIAVHCAERKMDLAASTAEMLRGAAGFYAEHFEVRQPLALAVLDKTEWTKVTSIPYGLPFVSGPPYIVVLPATGDHPLFRHVDDALDRSDLPARYSMTNEEISSHVLSLIGFHELGHLYAKAFGLEFPNRWTFEFAATAFAYAYLDQCLPITASLWVDACRALAHAGNPAHTSLRDFETLYVGVGIADYARYQAVFLLRVKEVHDAHGIQFLSHLRDVNWPATSPTQYVTELEAIAPGFNRWADKFQLLPSAQDGSNASR